MSSSLPSPQAWVDGERVDALPLSLLRALFYGDAVFETMRVVGGRAILLEAHVERLLGSTAALGMTTTFTRPAIVDELARIARSGSDHEEDRVLRVLVARRASFGLSRDESGAALRIVVLGAAPSFDLSTGLDVQIHEGRLHPLGSHKSTDYLGSILALGRAAEEGATDVLVVDGGKVLGGASSNVFGVLRGPAPRLVTPPLSDGILPGVTRRAVLELAAEEGFVVEERSLAVVELGGLAECFLTSSLRGIAPIVRIDRATVGEGRPGVLTNVLRSAYEARILRGSLTVSPRER